MKKNILKKIFILTGLIGSFSNLNVNAKEEESEAYEFDDEFDDEYDEEYDEMTQNMGLKKDLGFGGDFYKSCNTKHVNQKFLSMHENKSLKNENDPIIYLDNLKLTPNEFVKYVLKNKDIFSKEKEKTFDWEMCNLNSTIKEVVKELIEFYLKNKFLEYKKLISEISRIEKKIEETSKQETKIILTGLPKKYIENKYITYKALYKSYLEMKKFLMDRGEISYDEECEKIFDIDIEEKYKEIYDKIKSNRFNNRKILEEIKNNREKLKNELIEEKEKLKKYEERNIEIEKIIKDKIIENIYIDFDIRSRPKVKIKLDNLEVLEEIVKCNIRRNSNFDNSKKIGKYDKIGIYEIYLIIREFINMVNRNYRYYLLEDEDLKDNTKYRDYFTYVFNFKKIYKKKKMPEEFGFNFNDNIMKNHYTVIGHFEKRRPWLNNDKENNKINKENNKTKIRRFIRFRVNKPEIEKENTTKKQLSKQQLNNNIENNIYLKQR